MSTKTAQIKLTIPVELKELLDTKAMRFGIPVASYIRHLIMKDAEDVKYPVYKASKRVEEAYKQAMRDRKEGKLIKVDDINKFFEEL